MEISYYVECMSFKGDFNPTCLTEDDRTAEFTFGRIDNFSNNDSQKSGKIWARIEPLLKQSFGKIEVVFSMDNISQSDLSKQRRKIQKFQLIVQLTMRPVRHSAEDMLLLIKNNEEACKQFLTNISNDASENSCWSNTAKRIFSENGIEFIGVILNSTSSQEDASSTAPETSTMKPTSGDISSQTSTPSTTTHSTLIKSTSTTTSSDSSTLSTISHSTTSVLSTTTHSPTMKPTSESTRSHTSTPSTMTKSTTMKPTSTDTSSNTSTLLTTSQSTITSDSTTSVLSTTTYSLMVKPTSENTRFQTSTPSTTTQSSTMKPKSIDTIYNTITLSTTIHSPVMKPTSETTSFQTSTPSSTSTNHILIKPTPENASPQTSKTSATTSSTLLKPKRLEFTKLKQCYEWCIAWCKHLNFIPCHCRCGVKSISIMNSTSSFSITKPDKNEL